MSLHLKIAVRNLLREKRNSFFLLSSVCIGLVTFMLVSGYIFYEINYDRLFPDHKNIYRVTTEIFNANELSLHIPECERGVSSVIQEKYPEILAAGFLAKANNPQYKIGEEIFSNQSIYHASPGFTDVFSIQFVQGSAVEILTKPYTAVISESTAKRYFGTVNPVGQVLFKYPAYEYVIEGVYKDIPLQAHFNADVLLSFHDDMNLPPPAKAQWGETGFYTYLKLAPDADAKQIEEGVNLLVHENKGSYFQMNKVHHQYHLQPLNTIHLYSDLKDELQPNSRAGYLYLILITGLLILTASGFNYMQFSFSRFIQTAKTTGIKKINGASRFDIIFSSLTESIVMHVLALFISFAIAWLLSPYLQNRYNIVLMPVFMNPVFIIFLLCIVTISLIINGIVPAVLINRFNSIDLLMLKYKSVTGRISLRQTIVVAQFVIIIAIIAGITGMNKQVNFLVQKDKGFDVDNTLVLKVPQNIRKTSQRVVNLQAFENGLLSHSSILGISSSSKVPGDLPSYNFNFQDIHSEKGGKAAVIVADNNFLNNYKIELLAGNNFSGSGSSHDNRGCIINEACLQELGFQSPEDAVGRVLKMEDESGIQKFDTPVIGVAENVDFSDAKQKHEPLILIDWTKEMLWGNYSIKIKTSQFASVIPFIRENFMKTFPNYPFEYIILEDYYNKQFKAENQLIAIFQMFVLVAILIAVINLFSISFLISASRVKEIGIRKVNGAKVLEILALLNKDFIKWVIIAFLIATPVAWYGMNKWLENFAWKTTLSWWIFALAGLLALGIALLTVSWQSWKAATRNPVEALRYE